MNADQLQLTFRDLKQRYEKFGVLAEKNEEELELTTVDYIKLNVPLSTFLLSKNKRTWYLAASDFIRSIVKQSAKDILVFDDFELLMNPELGINFINLLLELSKVKAIIIVWRYDIEGTTLVYAQPGHNEYHRFELKEEQLFFG